jgi:hypothetical protein
MSASLLGVVNFYIYVFLLIKKNQSYGGRLINTVFNFKENLYETKFMHNKILAKHFIFVAKFILITFIDKKFIIKFIITKF